MSVLLVADAMEYLQITDPGVSVELQDMIDAAEAAIAKRVGPLASTTVTTRLEGGVATLVLPKVPAMSLTSVTPVGGTALDSSLLYLNEGAGFVEYVDGVTRFPYARYDVVYEAGRASVPDDLMHAVKDLLRFMWETQRGNQPAYSGALPADDGEVLSGTGGSVFYAFPRRVEQLIELYRTTDL